MISTHDSTAALTRVCMVTVFYPPAYSGAGRQCANLSEGLAQRGVPVHVLTSHGRTSGMPGHESPNSLLEIVRLGGAKVDGRWGAYQWGFRVAYELWRSRRAYDLVHFHSVNLWALPALLVAHGSGKRIVIKVTTLNEDDPVGLSRERAGHIKCWLFELADAVVGNSPGIRAAFANHRAVDRVHVIPNGIDTKRFCPVDDQQRRVLRSRLGLPQDGKIAVCVSAFTPRKGIEFLLEVWQQLKTETSPPLLLILGATDIVPDYFQQVCARSEALGLSPYIRFLGYLPNVPDYLQAADIFVFASTGEGLPSAVMEAMSCGLPIIMRRLPGVSDFLIAEGLEGFTFEPHDAVGFAGAVQNILASPHLAAKIGARVRQTAVDRFGLDRMVERYLALYSDLAVPFGNSLDVSGDSCEQKA